MMKKSEKLFRNKEDIISMFLGLAVVVVLALILVNFIERRKGTINLPGIKDENKSEERLSLEGKDVQKSKSVIVVKGDSLWKIAVKVYGDGYKWTMIAKENNLKNPGLLYSGQELKLPKVEEKMSVDDSEKGSIEKISINQQQGEYQVVKGDSLWKIAVKVYGDGYKWPEIWKENKNQLRSPDKLEIGMKLIVHDKI